MVKYKKKGVRLGLDGKEPPITLQGTELMKKKFCVHFSTFIQFPYHAGF